MLKPGRLELIRHVTVHDHTSSRNELPDPAVWSAARRGGVKPVSTGADRPTSGHLLRALDHGSQSISIRSRGLLS
eukprot:3309246-Prymnesium_polylepis.1